MAEPFDQDRLKSLKNLETPAPSSAAKNKAIGLAMEEFDDAQKEKTEFSSASPQGVAKLGRPMSIIKWIKGHFSMNARFPIAATLTGLLLLPVGIFLMQNSSLTPLPPINLPFVGGAEKSEQARTDVISGADAKSRAEAEIAVSSTEQRLEAPTEADARQLGALVQSQSVVATPLGRVAAPPLPISPTDDFEGFARQFVGDGDQFNAFDESAVKAVSQEPVSTFSIDVDTASYAYVRRALNEGRLPNPDAVRIEEMVNYFTYDYQRPGDAQNPFSPAIEIMATPWNANTLLMRIGIEGYVPEAIERQPANLVFLIDTSGSMDAPDKLPLLKRALTLLVDQLDDKDRVSIVAYAGSAGTVLAPTPASDKAAIIGALDRLGAGGSTAGAAGIELAYRLAEQGQVEGSVNRVILATDGDFNVGISSNGELQKFIENKREGGTFLTILGFGSGNLNDSLMQVLAQNGNGSAYYIDSFREAYKVLVEEVGSTLVTIAKDVKIQIEFNPALIAEYRLIGYETRALAQQDFNNDKVDAGEIGAGTSVTALYELTPVGAAETLIDPLRYGETVTIEGGEANVNEIGYFKLRYKLPDENSSRLIEMPITTEMIADTPQAASDDTRFASAVAAFGQKLRGSVYGGDMSYQEIRDLAAGAKGGDEQGYRQEFLSLVDLAASLSSKD